RCLHRSVQCRLRTSAPSWRIMADVRWIETKKIGSAGTLLPDMTIATITVATIVTIMVAGLRTMGATIKAQVSATTILKTTPAIARTITEIQIAVRIAMTRSTAMTRPGDTIRISLVVRTIATTITDNPLLQVATILRRSSAIRIRVATMA